MKYALWNHVSWSHAGSDFNAHMIVWSSVGLFPIVWCLFDEPIYYRDIIIVTFIIFYRKKKKTRLQACTSNQNCCPDILRVFCVLAKKVNNVVFKQCFSPYLVICQYLIIVHCQTTAKCVIAVHLIISIFQYYLMCI